MDVLYTKLEQAIQKGEIEAGVAEANKLVESGKTPFEIFSECIEPALGVIGEQFSRLEIFLPELINSAETVKAIQKALEPLMGADSNTTTKGKIIIATVLGDMHDIGKNIVKSMLEVNGYIVRDLGVDVSPQVIINSARVLNADLIALSALMLPSLPYMKDVIEFISARKDEREKYKIIVGGGSVSQEWADKVGADGYGENAIEAVAIAHHFLDLKA